MPTSLRVFFVVCLAIAAWLLWQAACLIWFPSAEHLARVGRAPEDYRHLAVLFDMISVIAWTLQAGIIAVFAALIVFGRRGWLRFVLAALIILRYVWPAASALLASKLPFSLRWQIYTTEWWYSPYNFLWLGVWTTVVVLMFLPGTRPWFHRQAATS